MTLDAVMAFLNTPIVVNVIPAIVSACFGSFITYWLLNRKEKHEKKEQLKDGDKIDFERIVTPDIVSKQKDLLVRIRDIDEVLQGKV